MNSYISSTNSDYTNLKCIIDHQAYRTKAEEDTENAVLAYRYELKRNICIVSLVTIVATSAILAIVLNPYYAGISIGGCVPIVVWVRFSFKYNHLKEHQNTQHIATLDIIKGIGKFFENLRENKIELLLEQPTVKDMRLSEQNYDIRNEYVEFCDLAKSAVPFIEHKYHIPRSTYRIAKDHPLADFQSSGRRLFDYHVNKRVVFMGPEKPYSRIAAYHPTYSVLVNINTKLLGETSKIIS